MSKKTSKINRKVNVTAVYFRTRGGLLEFPKRMEFEGETYNFLESGLQYLIRKGRSVVRILDLTDGTASYRLRQDSGQTNWTLVAITRQG